MRQRISSALQAVGQMRVLHAATAVYALSALVFRVVFALAIALAEAPPVGAAKGAGTVLAVLGGLGFDLSLPVLVYLAVFAYRVLRPIRSKMPQANLVATTFWLLVLFWNAMILGSHLNLLFTMNTGFTWSIFVEFFTVLSMREFLSLMTLKDYIAVVFPLVLFVLLLRTGLPRLARPGISVLVFLCSGGLMAVAAMATLGRFPDELTWNPHAFFFRDAARSIMAAREIPATKKSTYTGNVELAGDLFQAQPSAPGSLVPVRARRKANVVVVILESTAAEYVFDTTKYAGGKMPMPYLHSLAEKGLWFSRHFASNNSSPRSIFSIFSGLYESPETRFFSMEKKLKVPHLVDFLGKDYRRFLVTPADLDWYFPKAWFRNRGFAELDDYHALRQLPEYKAGPTSVRDEFRSVEYFTQKLAGEAPYLGVYYTFAGHWPYPDLGADNRLITPHSSRDRYINNLHVQDKLLQKIVAALEQSGQMQNTILVVVGDHGEAFYQHPGNRVHSAESYNENLMAPLVMYAPGLVKPGRVDQPTVHADILPTLLDLMGIPYDKTKLQGESALRQPYQRRYIFSFGNENTITSVSASLEKMQILRNGGKCRFFQLASDPNEQKNLECNSSSGQYRALEAFLRTQPSVLRSYNESCLTNGC